MDGIILINKPIGITSRDVVNKLTKIFGTKKMGHTGTLDPFASGVMIVTINKGTKISSYLENLDKEYVAEVVLGTSTDTLDLDGEVIGNIKNKEELENYINNEQKELKEKYDVDKVYVPTGVDIQKYTTYKKEVLRLWKKGVVNPLKYKKDHNFKRYLYLTKKHLEAMDEHGLCPYHRPSFLRKHFGKAEQLPLLKI